MIKIYLGLRIILLLFLPTDVRPLLTRIDQITLRIMHHRARTRIHKGLALPAPIPRLSSRNLQQIPRPLHIDLPQKLLIPIDHRRRRGVDHHIRLHSPEHLQHRLRRRDIAIVIFDTFEPIVHRPEVYDRHFRIVLGEPRSECGEGEAGV